MEQRTDGLYPSAPLEKDDLERRIEKRLSDVNSFNNSINKIKEMITYFKDKNNKSKKRWKNYKTLNTILESVDAIVIIGSTTTSVTLSVTGVGLIVVPISVGVACALSLHNTVIYKIIINKYTKYKNHYEKDEQRFKFLMNYIGRFHRKTSLIKMNMYLYEITWVKTLMKRKIYLFHRNET